jgi:hypothetical protein
LKKTEGERVAWVLDLLKEVSQDQRIKDRVHIKVLIGHDGGMSPEMMIVFHGPYFQEKFEAEVMFWAGQKEDSELMLIITVGDLVTLELAYHEALDLQQIEDVKPYFEKIMSFYE